jgi:hypothetical protein
MQPMARYLNTALASASGVAAALPRLVHGVVPRLGFDLQPIMHRLNAASIVLAGVAAGLRGLLDRLWRSSFRKRRAAAPIEVAAPAPRLGPARAWEMVVGVLTRDLAHVSAITAIQAGAALKIDAAEHALGRIVADCSKLLTAPLLPARQPARRLVHRPVLRTRRQLAA